MANGKIQEGASWGRFSIVAALLFAVGLLLFTHSGQENVPLAEPLDSFPNQVGQWQGTTVSIARETLEVLGSGEFLERGYSRSPSEPTVDLFIAYFPSQQTGSTMHSPQNCLPGSGWTPVGLTRVNLQSAGNGPLQANRYVLAKGLDHLLVYYWFQEHGRAVASEYWAKFYLVTDSIRMNRSDGALIRVMTPLVADESPAEGDKRSRQFIEAFLPYLDRVVPR